MHTSYGYHSSSYSMDEYLERLDRIQRMPSMMGEYPSFPNVHEVLNKQPTNSEENNHHQKKVTNKNHNQKNHQNPEKKVHFAEHDKKRTEAGKHVVEDKSVDLEADGYIEQKHKGFELCKWDTFKVY
ncbi:hypothetical protein C2S51_034715 [Perilla frutescens var. frutescens]|nr:hypothetical protein C2S51_034715 [Perilla frutescens var. frutescens]